MPPFAPLVPVGEARALDRKTGKIWDVWPATVPIIQRIRALLGFNGGRHRS